MALNCIACGGNLNGNLRYCPPCLERTQERHLMASQVFEDAHVEIIPADRAEFLLQTYLHLWGAILAFVALEIVLFQSGVAQRAAEGMLGVNWAVPLGAFVIVGALACHLADKAEDLATQYLGLGLYVLAEVVIFMPLLYIANRFVPGAIQSAAVVTLFGFTALTWIVFATRRNFSFLAPLLCWGGVAALLLIFATCAFGWNLGTWFSVAMITFAGGAVLYDTSQVMENFAEDQYVAGALHLFSSVALMFWYVLRLFLELHE